MTAAWMSDVQLVAEREVRERVRSKSFRLMTAVALIAISGVIMLSSARSAKPPAYRVALVDTPASSVADGLAFAAVFGSAHVQPVPVSDEAEARRLVASRRLS